MSTPYTFDGHGVNNAEGRRLATLNKCIAQSEGYPEFDQLGQLLAAAPELLRLLRENVDWMTDHGCVPPCHSEALNLINNLEKDPTPCQNSE